VGTTALDTGDQMFDIYVGDFSFAVDDKETGGIVQKSEKVIIYNSRPSKLAISSDNNKFVTHR